MDIYCEAVALTPLRFRSQLRELNADTVEEIRLRTGYPASALCCGRELALRGDRLSEAELRRVLEIATGASVHAAADQLRAGYVCSRGLRIGVCGTAASGGGELQGFSFISSLAVRIPRERRGLCEALIEEYGRSGFLDTLIISAPGVGKTTALRELIRSLSDKGLRVGVIDERNELAASDGECRYFDLGRCSDVLTGIGKSRGAMMLLRGMNPQVIAMDEISTQEDIEAAIGIRGCGVGILASAHAGSVEDLTRRPIYRRLLSERIFKRYVVIRQTESGRIYSVERAEA